MSGATFALAGARILVHDTDTAHVEWLAEFLAPAFERVEGEDADWRVTLVEDEARYRDAVARGPAGGALPAFSFDARVDPLPRWRSDADIALLDEPRGVLVEAWPRARAVRLLARTGAGRVPLMRSVREIGANHAQRRGGLLLHAAAVAVGGHGLVVSGPKRAGKTSLLLHLLRARGARYVSNDRVLVPESVAGDRRGGEARPAAVGVPTLVALRQGTLDLFPALAARLASSRYASRLTIGEARAGAPSPAVSGGKWSSVSPAQLCDLAGVAADACAPLAAIVLPRVTGEPGTFAVRRLAGEEVAAAIPDLLFGVHGGAAASTVLVEPGVPAVPDAEALARAVRRLTARVPCVECRLGLDAYASAGAADEMVAALLRATRRGERPC